MTRSPSGTVSFHNFKSQNVKLSISNPRSKYAVYLSALSHISNCQGLGCKNKHEILKTDRTANLPTKTIPFRCSSCTIGTLGVPSPPLAQGDIYIYIYIYMHICMYVCIICICVYMCVCIYIYIYIYLYVCICVYIYIYIYTHVYTHIMSIHVYIYIYIYIYICPWGRWPVQTARCSGPCNL